MLSRFAIGMGCLLCGVALHAVFIDTVYAEGLFGPLPSFRYRGVLGTVPNFFVEGIFGPVPEYLPRRSTSRRYFRR